jgi:hypothetical protein
VILDSTAPPPGISDCFFGAASPNERSAACHQARAVGVSGSTTRQKGVTAWSPDSRASTAAAAMSRNTFGL